MDGRSVFSFQCSSRPKPRAWAGEFRSIREINNEIRRLNLSAYAPLRYVLPHRQTAYDAKYSTQIRGGARAWMPTPNFSGN